MKVFTEIGFGNETFINTELEDDHGNETRQPGFVSFSLKGIYLRIWIGYKVFVASTVNGFSITKKPKRRFKFLFGLEGIPKS
ncbi:MAG: DUF3977 family protein [Pseudomonadota bacterium]|nr:DUF3977 family protein [Pseudomonadota bacterium]